ncbi:MAG: pyocin knob domain-containing protein [Treponema sp.]|nr:pyocin knob domain-containing protein [Treponema sp.]
MAGYPIASLKKAEEISGQDIFPVQQNGVTKQIERSILDQAVIVSETGPQSSGIIRKEGVFVLKNDAQIIFTLENAAGRIVENNEYVDSAEAASGWIIYVVNTSEIQHIVIHGQNSWPIPAGETLVFFWTGSHFTLHNIVINNLTVRGDTKLLEVPAVQTLVAGNKLAVIGADGKVVSTTVNDIVGLANVDGKIDAKLVDYQTKLTFNGTPSATNKVVTDSALNNALTDYQKATLSITTETDADTLKDIGIYHFTNVKITNIPTEATTGNVSHGFIEVNSYGGANKEQFLRTYNAGKAYVAFRRFNGSTWGDWEKYIKETDLSNVLAEYGKIQKVRLVSKTTRTFTLETNHIYQLVISHINDTSYNGLYIISNQTTLNTVTSNSKYTLSFESNVVSIYNSGTGNPTAFLTDLGKIA